MARYFKTGVGVTTCESCGKKTRLPENNNLPYCTPCTAYIEHENVHNDNPDGNCLDGNECLLITETALAERMKNHQNKESELKCQA